MQIVQNKSLRLVTGCHSIASADHLPAECGELSVEDHLRLISALYLAKSLQPDHVNFNYVKMEIGNRTQKQMLRSKCINDV